ncbi:MAG TPA: T9SS type A sorting domain-containing protein [Candidatus Cloacimonetes bacterium]|nr:T9SS type A sorting domain-containing protein [Candidatus Cloacimonadota bacterium]
MKKIVLILCVIFVVSVLTADSRIKTIADLQNMSNKERKDYFFEMYEQIMNLRDLYILEELHQDWENEAWVNDEKIIYTWSTEGFLDEMLWLTWEEGAWQNAQWQIHTNNAEGYPIETLYKMWEPISGTWMDMAMILYTYDANWNMIEMLMQMWFIDQWMDASRYTMTYNNDNNPIQVLSQEWDFEGGTGWLNSGLETYTYDGLFLQEILDQMWENDSEWITNHRLTFTEAGNAYPATELRENWNLVEWTNDWYHQFFYDNDWNEIQTLEQDWEDDQWVNWEDHYYTYEDGYQIERLTYRWEGGRDWVNHSFNTYTWGTLDAEDNSISPDNVPILTNYPNPFSETTTISFSTTERTENTGILIYNLKGQEVKTLILSGNEVSVVWNGKDNNGSQVANGVYLYKIKAGKYTSTKKMILMK